MRQNNSIWLPSSQTPFSVQSDHYHFYRGVFFFVSPSLLTMRCVYNALQCLWFRRSTLYLAHNMYICVVHIKWNIKYLYIHYTQTHVYIYNVMMLFEHQVRYAKYAQIQICIHTRFTNIKRFYTNYILFLTEIEILLFLK